MSKVFKQEQQQYLQQLLPSLKAYKNKLFAYDGQGTIF